MFELLESRKGFQLFSLPLHAERMELKTDSPFQYEQRLKLKPMRRLLFTFIISVGAILTATAQGVVHSTVGATSASADGSVSITVVTKKQQFDYSDKATLDSDIYSPKSVNIHPDGTKFYVNSLEGGATVVYEIGSWKKLKTIHHQFDARHHDLWAPASGLFPFTHYSSADRDLNEFMGKPVESTFSHHGRYLWVPYYRRSYDINAQDPSALAVIDTERDTIIRLMETGPLPKMIACSHDGQHIAVSHWGDNTVGIINIAGDDPSKWAYEKLHIIDYQLKLNYSLTTAVNRDVNSGYTLRGTVFTPDDHYLLVGCMGGSGGIAVIDMQQKQYLGRVLGMRGNIRHLIIKDGWLYLSSNAAGVIQRMRLDQFLDAALQMSNHTAMARGWEECAVMGGARTIEASPSGRFIFAACNTGSKLCVVDTRQMKMVATINADSYPVGLDISSDGRYVIVTSQGRSKLGGGNAVNIYEVKYKEAEELPASERQTATIVEPEDSIQTLDSTTMEETDDEGIPPLLLYGGGAIIALLLLWGIVKKMRK